MSRKKKKRIRKLLIKVLSVPLKLLPKNKNKIIFISDTREELGGNLKFMYDYIPDSYKKITILKEDMRVKRKFREKIRMLINLSTAKYIFFEGVVKAIGIFEFSKRQELIQLWHGPGAFKKFGFSRLEEKDSKLSSTHKGYTKYTKAIVSGEGIRENYAEAFGISIDKVFATGFLRTDAFFDNEYINQTKMKLYEKFPQFKSKKVIMFAPTYRGTPYRSTKKNGASYDFSKLDFKKLYEKLSNEYVFIFKWHPALYNNMKLEDIKLNIDEYSDFYFDLSEYRDINDLLLITDVLITDYSSVIFDYLLLEKPVVYFTYDLEEYSNDRGLYYPFDDYVYGEVAEDCDAMIRSIKNENLMLDKRELFKNKFMAACDGNSTKKTYELIFEEQKSD